MHDEGCPEWVGGGNREKKKMSQHKVTDPWVTRDKNRTKVVEKKKQNGGVVMRNSGLKEEEQIPEKRVEYTEPGYGGVRGAPIVRAKGRKQSHINTTEDMLQQRGKRVGEVEECGGLRKRGKGGVEQGDKKEKDMRKTHTRGGLGAAVW